MLANKKKRFGCLIFVLGCSYPIFKSLGQRSIHLHMTGHPRSSQRTVSKPTPTSSQLSVPLTSPRSSLQARPPRPPIAFEVFPSWRWPCSHHSRSPIAQAVQIPVHDLQPQAHMPIRQSLEWEGATWKEKTKEITKILKMSISDEPRLSWRN
jgi:hypothetical protein